MTVFLGAGTKITFASSSWEAAFELISANYSMSRDPIDVTHMESPDGAREFVPSEFADYGELSGEVHIDPGTEPPWDQAIESITLELKDNGASTGSQFVFQGFMSQFDMPIPLDDKLTSSFTFKVTGKPVHTPHA